MLINYTNVTMQELRPDRAVSGDMVYRLLSWEDDNILHWELLKATVEMGDSGDAETGPQPYLYVTDFTTILTAIGRQPTTIEEAIKEAAFYDEQEEKTDKQILRSQCKCCGVGCYRCGR